MSCLWHTALSTKFSTLGGSTGIPARENSVKHPEIHFSVDMGSYKISLDKNNLACTCPSFRYQKLPVSERTCKHTIKVAKALLDIDDSLISQKPLSIVSKSPELIGRQITEPPSFRELKEKYAKYKRSQANEYSFGDFFNHQNDAFIDFEKPYKLVFYAPVKARLSKNFGKSKLYDYDEMEGLVDNAVLNKCSDYGDESDWELFSRDSKTTENKFKGWEIGFVQHQGCVTQRVEIELQGKLDENELQDIIRNYAGQMSDGIGEGEFSLNLQRGTLDFVLNSDVAEIRYEQ